MDTQTTEAQAGSSARDTALLVASLALLVGGLVAFYYFADQANLLVRWLAMLGAIGASLALAYRTRFGRELWGYVSGARIELRKVVWPSRQESVQATLMIAVVVLIAALLLWGLDSLLLWGVETITGRDT